ncbi:uncharacterized protein LOC126371624 [Pectinophora gossypiella]|uniref:uncharacterized protein LOC126371624 n=1 Tax=Pectinophora gossypiella TaxID=13191 RepID=UPI00214E06E4|nr:uncharacterized protein LOC126371624 [Pectinophora gossypiella]
MGSERRVEEVFDDTSPPNRLDDPRMDSHLVSFLIKNVKKIFKDNYDEPVLDIDNTVQENSLSSEEDTDLHTSTLLFRPTVSFSFRPEQQTGVSSNVTITSTITDIDEIISIINASNILVTIPPILINTTIGVTTDVFMEPIDVAKTANVTLKPVSYLLSRKSYKTKKTEVEEQVSEIGNETTTTYLPPMRTSLHLLLLATLDTKEETLDQVRNYNISENVMFTTEFGADLKDLKRSCIMCDNVAIDGCSSPKNSLIPSMVCEYDDSLCYSLHTPFGIVDRGCFSMQHNMTTYVCACNLCNYESITDMPIIFSNKRDWIENVFDLTYSRRLKKSVFKGMTCLKCETNSTAGGDPIDNSNCLEGRIANIPTQICADNEVCAVRAIKAQGYVWRGCVNNPLYNYYMTFCDSDLCNYDEVASVYDPI